MIGLLQMRQAAGSSNQDRQRKRKLFSVNKRFTLCKMEAEVSHMVL